MTKHALHIEVIEHFADEFVVYLAQQACDGEEGVLAALDEVIKTARADGIRSYLTETYGENSTDGIDADGASGITINIASSEEEVTLVQIQIPYERKTGRLIKTELTVDQWDVSEMSLRLAEKIRVRHQNLYT
jgi:hypothetical protein